MASGAANMSDPSLTQESLTLMPPPTGTHQSRSASRSMNRRKREHMSKESLTLNMPLLRLLSSQPVVGSVRKLPPSIRDAPLSSLINGTSLQYHNELVEMHPILPLASILYTMHLCCTLLDRLICQSSFTS